MKDAYVVLRQVVWQLTAKVVATSKPTNLTGFARRHYEFFSFLNFNIYRNNPSAQKIIKIDPAALH